MPPWRWALGRKGKRLGTLRSSRFGSAEGRQRACGCGVEVAWQPIALAESMWSHATGMREEFAKRRFLWSELTSQELTDILVYLQNHPSIPRRQATFDVNSGTGEEFLHDKGCLKCHHGALAFAYRLGRRTIDDVAVAMWNHDPKMTVAVETFKPGEMRVVISYIWAKQFFENTGDIARGKKVFAKKVFAEKSCAGGHEHGSAPRLTGDFNVVRLISALWSHGPAMWKQMQDRRVPWPRFTVRHMSNLMAYLNSTH